MILSGEDINLIRQGKSLHHSPGSRIVIDPFDEKNLNPNSYNLSLDRKLLRVRGPLDAARPTQYEEVEMSKSGFLLEPGVLYLGSTVEYTETHGLVPIIDGRSSVGRLGIFVHVTAGYGDNGYCGKWTLELACIVPVVIYPNMKICQIRFQSVTKGWEYSSDKYQNSMDVQPSKLWKELQ